MTDKELLVAAHGGWLEAAIAWEVCASIHREYAKGKDALFTARHADFVKHADDARKKAANQQDNEYAQRTDARRYRWLRDNPTHESTPYFDDGKWLVPYLVSGDGGSGGGVGVKTFDTLDSAIDEAVQTLALGSGHNA